MRFLKNIIKDKIVIAFLMGFIIGLPLDGVYLFNKIIGLWPFKSTTTTTTTTTTIPESFYLKIDTDKYIKEIESYLNSISPKFINDVELLATEHNVPSWGCGPSAYALAKIINNKFFNGKVVIDASYNDEPYQIVERFGLAQFESNGKAQIGDHAWLEIYFKNKFLFVDPTIAQYGKVNSIVYQVFQIGDPTIRETLNSNYGIIDDRMTPLVNKAVNRVSIDQDPYPGFTIDPAYINYFLQVLSLRNIVDTGQEPLEWKPWVSVLENKYSR